MQFDQLKRREFVTLFSGAAAWPMVARAQQQNTITIGVLVRAAPGWQRFWQLFPEALRDLGYIEGKNIRFEFRSDEGQMSRLPELAAELVRRKVNVIVPWFTPAAIAAKEATHEIPIICAACGDMVGTGLVESLARPGGNITGNSSLNAELAAKTVELIREMVPSAKRIAALANAADPFSKSFLKQIQLAGEATGTAIESIMIRSAASYAGLRRVGAFSEIPPIAPANRIQEHRRAAHDGLHPPTRARGVTPPGGYVWRLDGHLSASQQGESCARCGRCHDHSVRCGGWEGMEG